MLTVQEGVGQLEGMQDKPGKIWTGRCCDLCLALLRASAALPYTFNKRPQDGSLSFYPVLQHAGNQPSVYTMAWKEEVKSCCQLEAG
ncbi:hypothetical protein AV530_015550 [Patagioenas fasciata monilis]|uniref:Uncharacterized protein n=1 Tax=Patagioenas fasciata monilis TaxID=372326 RepID=A0A1V4KI50_PATFA|nr:hypothetical protein AV530_015550 [Patagioenas fasciata monilis]